jgi:PilZ domain
MSSKEKQEHRQTKRVQTKVPVTAKKQQNGAFEELSGETRDVSPRGIFMYLSNKVAEGAELEVVFPMPGEAPGDDTWVRCKARVLRVETSNSGDRFGVAAVLESYEKLEEKGKQ